MRRGYKPQLTDAGLVLGQIQGLGLLRPLRGHSQRLKVLVHIIPVLEKLRAPAAGTLPKTIVRSWPTVVDGTWTPAERHKLTRRRPQRHPRGLWQWGGFCNCLQHGHHFRTRLPTAGVDFSSSFGGLALEGDFGKALGGCPVGA